MIWPSDQRDGRITDNQAKSYGYVLHRTFRTALPSCKFGMQIREVLGIMPEPLVHLEHGISPSPQDLNTVATLRVTLAKKCLRSNQPPGAALPVEPVARRTSRFHILGNVVTLFTPRCMRILACNMGWLGASAKLSTAQHMTVHQIATMHTQLRAPHRRPH